MKSTLRDKPDCPTPTRRLPFLVVDDGREKGKIISIGRASLTLGRDKNSGIRIEARGVSRRHARFHIRRGTVKLEDLGSTNGTWRNGKRVKWVTLRDGDQLQFGACIATFRQDCPDEPRLKRSRYCLVLPDCSLQKARVIAAKLRGRITTLNISEQDLQKTART